MAEHDSPKREPKLPQDESPVKHEAGERPVPTPGRIGNLPDDNIGPGKPIAFPTHEPRR